MNNFNETTYFERIARVYDQLYSDYDERCIQTLGDIAEGGPALEFGIGTGRIALALRKKGVEVHGIP